MYKISYRLPEKKTNQPCSGYVQPVKLLKAFMDIMGTKECVCLRIYLDGIVCLLPSRGNAVNTVDIIYASMPIYLYLNPSILGYLLSPLLEYQEGSQYTNSYAAVDLG